MIRNRTLSPGAQLFRAKRLAALDAHRWPKFGGSTLDRKPTPVFAPHRDEQPRDTAYFAIMRCTGTDRLGARLRHPVRAISAMIDPDYAAHVRSMRAVFYGETHVSPSGKLGRPEPGWDDWSVESVAIETPLIPHSPVTIADNVVTVVLPPGLTARQFHSRLARAIRTTALHRYSQTGPGATCCALSVTPPERLCRATDDPLFGGGPVDDIHLFDPGHDMGRLIRTAELIVMETLTASRARPKTG